MHEERDLLHRTFVREVRIMERAQTLTHREDLFGTQHTTDKGVYMSEP
jgi:hypothetical protein